MTSFTCFGCVTGPIMNRAQGRGTLAPEGPLAPATAPEVLAFESVQTIPGPIPASRKKGSSRCTRGSCGEYNGP
jgi:hypothetical protein